MSHPVAAQQFDCDQGRIRLAIEVFSPRTTAARLAAEQRRLMGDIAWEDVQTFPVPNGSGWRLWKTLSPPRVVVTGIWVGGKPFDLGLVMRVRMAWRSMFGGSFKPLLMVLRADTNPLSADPFDAERAATLLVSFVRSHPTLSALASHLADIND